MKRFSEEYFDALKNMDHALHKEAMEIRSLYQRGSQRSIPEPSLKLMAQHGEIISYYE